MYIPPYKWDIPLIEERSQHLILDYEITVVDMLAKKNNRMKIGNVY